MARAVYGPWHDLDLEAEGRHVGHLHVPISTSRSAYGNLRIPLVLIRRGRGKLALLMAGNHGDEFEGQVALARIARRLEPQHLEGGVVIMPAANLPAVLASTRTSPLDGGNFNTAFPGRIDGSATEQIAHFVATELLPRVAAWIDLHSGGGSLLYTPLAAIHRAEDPALDDQSLTLLQAFGAPTSVAFRLQHERAASSAAQRHRVPYIYGEFGGAATLDPAALRVAEEGTLRVLGRLGILTAASGLIPPPRPVGPLLETVTGIDFRATRRNFAFAPSAGVFERGFALGDLVRAGDLVGHIHAVEEPDRPPAPVRFAMDGIAIACRHLARVEAGDCLAQLAFESDWQEGRQ